MRRMVEALDGGAGERGIISLIYENLHNSDFFYGKSHLGSNNTKFRKALQRNLAGFVFTTLSY